MKKICRILVVLMSLSLFTACGADAGSDELVSYINDDLPKIAELELKVTEGYSSVSGDNYKDDETMYSVIKDQVIGDSSKLIDAAEAVKIEDEKLKDIHEIYISAINKQHQAFTIILAAIEAQDYNKITDANAILSDARKENRDYVSKLQKLEEEYGVTVE